MKPQKPSAAHPNWVEGSPPAQEGFPTPPLLPTERQSLPQAGKTNGADDIQVLGRDLGREGRPLDLLRVV